MLTSRLFWKLFIAYAVLVAIFAGAFTAVVQYRQSAMLMEQTQSRLKDTAIVLRRAANQIVGTDSKELPKDADDERSVKLQSAVAALGGETGTRLTVVTSEGIVIADSDEEPGRMENHKNRAEFAAARVSEFGSHQRVSATLGIPMMYVAVQATAPGGDSWGYVRAASDLRAIEEHLAALRTRIWFTVFLLGCAALALTFFLIRWLIQPLPELTAAATAVARGDVHLIHSTRADEFGTVADAFNSMSRQLSTKIGELESKAEDFARSSDRLQAVLSGMVEGVIAIDENQRVQFANDAARKLLSLRAGHAEGRPLWEVIRHTEVQDMIETTLHEGEQPPVEFEIPRLNKTVSMVGSRMSSETPGAVFVFHDVTELRRLENLRREFVAGTSHELKTPLAAISGYAETLLGGAMHDDAHATLFLERIIEQCDRLHHLIIDMLSLARIESGTEAFDLVPTDVPAVTAECLRQHLPQAESKSIALSSEGDPMQVVADPEGLRTILDNLLDNALNYTSAGGAVGVSWEGRGDFVEIVVKDTGSGIAAAHHERIFERFYRVDKARSREMGGTGLGLSIVKHLAQVFGGGVTVASVPNEGSTFTVRLPRHQPD